MRETIEGAKNKVNGEMNFKVKRKLRLNLLKNKIFSTLTQHGKSFRDFYGDLHVTFNYLVSFFFLKSTSNS